MKAVVLAAGVGARLGDSAMDSGGALPKILLEFGGRSLLERHLDALRGIGVGEMVLVTGYRGDEVEAAARGLAGDFISCRRNPAFREGSVVSLAAAGDVLEAGEGALLLDADVLYDPAILARLAGSPHADCLLLDREFDEGEEPVKVCIRDGRIVEFRKSVSGRHKLRGESVGFFRFAPATAAALAREAGVRTGDGRGAEPCEEAIREIILSAPGFGWEDITGLAWIEIDFPDDLRRARDDILPRLETRP